jgi:phytoene/squalene synthetase
VKLAKTELETSDKEYCWAIVSRVQPLFLISAPYLSKVQTDGVLALYALFAAIEEVFFKVTDESVARAKLTWWAEQVLIPEAPTNDHPIVRQLHRTGAIAAGARKALELLMHTSLSRVDAPAPANPVELKMLCTSVGLHPLQLELALSGYDHESATMKEVGAVNGLLQLLRESSRSPGRGYRWLPMSLLARHGVSQTELALKARSRMVMELIWELCQLGESWSMNDAVADRHCHVLAELNLRLLRHLKTINLNCHAKAFATTSLADSFHAWRSARHWSASRALK